MGNLKANISLKPRLLKQGLLKQRRLMKKFMLLWAAYSAS